MAELADAYGSGPYESNFMEVQVLLPAPIRVSIWILGFLFWRSVIMNICTNIYYSKRGQLLLSG